MPGSIRSSTTSSGGCAVAPVVRGADAGWRVRETEVPYPPRTGRSKVTGTWRGTWHAVHDMRAVLAEASATATTVAGVRGGGR